MRGLAGAFVAGLALLAMPAGAAAQSDQQQMRVRGYLEHGLQRHAALGYARQSAVADVVAPLRLDHPYLWSVYLSAGTTYRVYGACDDNCADLDMEIYGGDGHLVDRDTARDDTPYVQITPARSGRVYVRIWLYSCRADACYVAARVVAGGTAAPRERVEAPAAAAPQEPDEADKPAAEDTVEQKRAGKERTPA